MEVTDFPITLSSFLQLLLQPLKLLGVHVIAVEHVKADIAFLEGVIGSLVHVEELVEALVRIVVVAE